MKKQSKYTYDIKRPLYSFWFHRNRYIYDLSRSEFSEIYYAIMDECRNQILTNPHGIELPLFMGNIFTQWIDTTLSKYKNPLYNKGLRVGYIIRKHVKFNKYISFIAFKPSRPLYTGTVKNAKENGEKFKDERVSANRLFGRLSYKKYLENSKKELNDKEGDNISN